MTLSPPFTTVLALVESVRDGDLPAGEYLLGAALTARAPVTLVLPLQPLPGGGGAGGLQELVLDGGDGWLDDQGHQEAEGGGTRQIQNLSVCWYEGAVANSGQQIKLISRN